MIIFMTSSARHVNRDHDVEVPKCCGSTKETTEALYGTIIYSDMMRQNGNRINKRPLVDITPFVGGLCGGRAKKKTKDWKPGN